MKPNRSGLRRLQRTAGWSLVAIVVALVANSLFLATAITPEGLVAPMQRLHLILGVALCVVLPAFVWGHFALHRRHRNLGARRIGLTVATIAAIGCLVGLGLWAVGKSRAVRWLVIVHEGAFVLAVGAYLLHRWRATATPALRAEWIGAGVAAVLVAGIWTAQVGWPPGPRGPDLERPAFVPGLSQARTLDGHVLGPDDLGRPDYCAQCHPGIAARWESSVHHFGSLNDPFYAATLAVGQAHRSPDELKFCGGCHDPQLLLTGRMDEHPQPDDPGADEGITCLTCHAMVKEPTRQGNASYVLAAPRHYPGYDDPDPDEREASNRLLRSKPDQHIESFGPPHLRQPELCLACHKAHIPEALNGYRWLRGQNEYDAWHDSGAGGNSARTFFPPAKEQRRCQDCHMPRIADPEDPAAVEGTVADHAFLGANTALPRALGDEEWVARNEAFLREVITVDIGAIEVTTPASDDAVPSEASAEGAPSEPRDAAAPVVRRLAPIGPVSVPAGAPVTVDVVVRNTGSGHLFPGGIADLREVWLEITLRDAADEAIAASGWLDPGGHLDPDAHRWNAVLLDGEGVPLRVHEVETAHVVLTSRRIMLGASDVVRVAFTAPRTPGRLEVRVMHRKFPRDYVEFALGPQAPRMPVTALARTTMALVPGPATAPPPGSDAGPRLRNLGIGHLLRGDTALADQAAAAAVVRLPDDPGPHLDRARAALADGALARAEAHVRDADALAPGHPTAAWLLARIRAAQGDHVAALAALDVALAAFPRDRELLVMRGDSLFRLERDDEAADVLEQVLLIDPEHVSAHALLTRIRAEQGDEAAAQRHREAWDRVRPRSDDDVISERARRADPALDRRANQQYVLPLVPPPAGWSPATASTSGRGT